MHWSRESWIGLAAVVFALLIYYLLHWVGMAFLDAIWAGHGLERGAPVAVLLGPLVLALVLVITAVVAAVPAWGLLFAMGVGRFLGHRAGLWPLLGLSAPEGEDLRAHLGPGRHALRTALEAVVGVGLFVPLGLLYGSILVAVGGGGAPSVLVTLLGYGLGFVLAWATMRLLVRYWGRLEALRADALAQLERGALWLDFIGQRILRQLNGGRLPRE
ncbi:hypothetical protein Hhal_1168 [Halorhodospira halophila SL1]|uniref:Transmembrane protein n=2 Tax=Halorhodospira halophila TaxID=1053 RepID=A1WW81_HALHL|nr:hypothetical protein Hhal_1168 [Halorhodospira halophila SL1]MBK1729729.1 hypothetical protein [Halorhodospira halophila]